MVAGAAPLLGEQSERRARLGKCRGRRLFLPHTVTWRYSYCVREVVVRCGWQT
jgi:hypothetical protein